MTMHATANAPDLALFDFDGTLTTRETFADFVRAVVSPVRGMLGVPLFAPMLLGYRAGWVSGSAIRAALTRYAFRGLREERVREIAEAFARNVLPGLLRGDAMQRLARHRARGDTVAVVSGAFELCLRPWCEQQGVPLIASRLDVVDGVLTGRYLGAQCVGEEKARRVREQYDLTRFGTIHAYGDTHEDLAMLALADRRYFRGELVEGVIAAS